MPDIYVDFPIDMSDIINQVVNSISGASVREQDVETPVVELEESQLDVGFELEEGEKGGEGLKPVELEAYDIGLQNKVSSDTYADLLDKILPGKLESAITSNDIKLDTEGVREPDTAVEIGKVEPQEPDMPDLSGFKPVYDDEIEVSDEKPEIDIENVELENIFEQETVISDIEAENILQQELDLSLEHEDIHQDIVYELENGDFDNPAVEIQQDSRSYEVDLSEITNIDSEEPIIDVNNELPEQDIDVKIDYSAGEYETVDVEVNYDVDEYEIADMSLEKLETIDQDLVDIGDVDENVVNLEVGQVESLDVAELIVDDHDFVEVAPPEIHEASDMDPVSFDLQSVESRTPDVPNLVGYEDYNAPEIANFADIETADVDIELGSYEKPQDQENINIVEASMPETPIPQVAEEIVSADIAELTVVDSPSTSSSLPEIDLQDISSILGTIADIETALNDVPTLDVDTVDVDSIDNYKVDVSIPELNTVGDVGVRKLETFEVENVSSIFDPRMLADAPSSRNPGYVVVDSAVERMLNT